MIYLLDTHVMLWAAYEPQRLNDTTRALISDPAHTLVVSAASIWEVAIKSGLGRPDFTVDASLLRRALTESGYQELSITSSHAAAVTALPPLHKDPFDRILIAQARAEGIPLLTADPVVAGYGSPAQLIR